MKTPTIDFSPGGKWNSQISNNQQAFESMKYIVLKCRQNSHDRFKFDVFVRPSQSGPVNREWVMWMAPETLLLPMKGPIFNVGWCIASTERRLQCVSRRSFAQPHVCQSMHSFYRVWFYKRSKALSHTAPRAKVKALVSTYTKITRNSWTSQLLNLKLKIVNSWTSNSTSKHLHLQLKLKNSYTSNSKSQTAKSQR